MSTKNEHADEKGAVESEVQRITTIKGDEVLGYEGMGREEHSGQDTPDDTADPLANNRPEETSGATETGRDAQRRVRYPKER